MPSAKAELDIPPPLTIRHAPHLKQMILDAMKEHPFVSLRLPQLPSVDLSFIQLVEAARIYASRNGLGLSLADPAAGDLLELVEAAGLDSDAQKFWLCQGENR